MKDSQWTWLTAHWNRDSGMMLTKSNSVFGSRSAQRGTHGELAAVDGRPHIGVVPKAAAEALGVQILRDGVARVPEPVLDLQGVRHPTPQRARLHIQCLRLQCFSNTAPVRICSPLALACKVSCQPSKVMIFMITGHVLDFQEVQYTTPSCQPAAMLPCSVTRALPAALQVRDVVILSLLNPENPLTCKMACKQRLILDTAVRSRVALHAILHSTLQGLALSPEPSHGRAKACTSMTKQGLVCSCTWIFLASSRSCFKFSATTSGMTGSWGLSHPGPRMGDRDSTSSTCRMVKPCSSKLQAHRSGHDEN